MEEAAEAKLFLLQEQEQEQELQQVLAGDDYYKFAEWDKWLMPGETDYASD